MEYHSPKFNEMYINKDDIDNYNKILEEKDKREIFKGVCYGYKNADNREECIKNMGKWDSQVNEDSECPYYKANINYPNTFGKIKNGVCELPVNMKNVGYRGYSRGTGNIPLCYNCKYNKIGVGSLGYCCDDQLSKGDIYKNLSSPDYAYVGDKVERKKWESLFLEKGLGVE
jgi:hypothetical protein